jgi:hypothetical protein
MARTSKKKATADVKTTAPAAAPETQAAPSQQQQPPTTINVGDIALAAQYIDVAFRRGAFQASEAAEVGTLFNKLAGFVSAYNKKVEEDRKAQEAAQGDE